MPGKTLELKTYYGNCHCGAFKFNFQSPELKNFKDCNCSICLKRGTMWVFPVDGEFVVERGEHALKSYEFGTGTISHKFCPVCGTGVWGVREVPGQRNVGLNARALRDLEVWSLESKPFSGSALEPAYMPPKFTGAEPTTEIEGARLYTGGCHCGAVTVAVKAKPFPMKGEPAPKDGEYIQQCNCSICQRNGTTLIYPHRDQVSISDPSNNLTAYMFGRKLQKHMFCKTCGVSICIEKTSPSEEEAAKWADAKQETWKDILPINLRALDGIDWDRIDVRRFEMARDMEPKYRVD